MDDQEKGSAPKPVNVRLICHKDPKGPCFIDTLPKLDPSSEATPMAYRFQVPTREIGEYLVHAANTLPTVEAERDALALEMGEARGLIKELSEDWTFEELYDENGPCQWCQTSPNDPEHDFNCLAAMAHRFLLRPPPTPSRVKELRAAVELAKVAEREYLRCSFAPVWSTDATIRMMEAIHPFAQAYRLARSAKEGK